MANLNKHSKECSKCLLILELYSYSKDNSKKDGFHTVCKVCQKKTKSLRTAEAKEVRKIHYNLNKEISSNYHKNKNANPEVKYKLKEKHLLKTYDLSLKDLEQLRTDQKFKCAICKKHEDDCSRKTLFVDHNHNTGKIRGLLCSQCNSALGLFYDNIEVIKAAINYLELND